MDESVQFYKEKCDNSERNLQNLKDLAHKGVADYEDLKKKYDQNHKQYDAVRAELEHCQAQLQEVNKLIQPAYEEYNELETKLVIEEQLKSAAESYASKINNQNNKLKRQSQMLLDMVSERGLTTKELETITQDDGEEENDSPRETQEDHYNKIIEELRDQLAETKTELKTAKESSEQAAESEKIWKNKYELEKENAKRTQSSLQQHQSSLSQFKRVSTMAYKEFDDLQKKLQMEEALKNEAIKYASQVLSQKNAIQRQSVAAITDAAGDQRVHKAFTDIEELSKTLETERVESKKKIEELESALKLSDDVESVSKLQDQIDAFSEQVADLKKQLADITLWRDKLTKENKELIDKLDVAEQKLRPPPPPPPPPIPTILRPLAKIMGRKKKPGPAKAPGADEKGNAAFNSALEEMMQRIKKGGDIKSTLRPAAQSRRPSLPESSSSKEASSMNELHSLLSNLKRSKSVDVGRPDNNNKEEPNELSNVFGRIRNGSKKKNLSNIDEGTEDNRGSKELADPSVTEEVFKDNDQ